MPSHLEAQAMEIETAIAFRSEAKARRLNVIVRQDPHVNLRAATCESFRGCDAGGRRGDRRRTFNVQLKRGELRFRRNYPGALIARLPGSSLRFISCAGSYLTFFPDNQRFVPGE